MGAAYYMVFYTLVVSLPLLVSVFWYIHFGFLFIYFFHFSVDGLVGVFYILVFLVKLPVYGVHLWLPKAHVEAPLAGSIVLAGVLLKLGVYGLVRFSSFSSLFFYLFGSYLLSIGLIGRIFSCFICLRQPDMKSLVAYSSINHIGVCLGSIACFFFCRSSWNLYNKVFSWFGFSLYVLFDLCILLTFTQS